MIIDGGLYFGRRIETGENFTAEDLLGKFDRYGVSRGIVGSFRSLFQDLRKGNEELHALSKTHPGRIEPAGTLHSAYYGETPEQLLGWMKNELGFRVAVLSSCPAYYQVNWRAPFVREIGRAAANLGIVLQACIRTEDELLDISKTWGDLPLTVMIRWMGGQRYRMFSSELLVAKSCPRFLFDVGNMTGLGNIEMASERIGANRLFSASNAPVHLYACASRLVMDASLANDEREQILGGTLATLLPAADNILPRQPAEWQHLLGRPKVDVHWHPDGWNLGEPALDQLEIFNKFHYERVIVFPVLGLNHDLLEGNRLAEEWVGHDLRIHAFIVVDPARPEDSLSEISRLGDHPRFVGLKTIQDTYNVGLDHEIYEPILREAERRDLPVFAHLRGCREAAQKFPGVRFVAAHANFGRAAHLAPYKNIFFDFATSHSFSDETQLPRFVRAVGKERVMFGSDAQLMTPAWSLAKLLDQEFTEEELQMILRDNAHRVFPKLKRS